MRLSRALVLIGLTACAHAEKPQASASTSEPHEQGETAPTASSALTNPDAGAGDAATAADLAPPPKVVLHTGDSMVGFHAGLERALAPHFEALGAKYIQDAVTSAAIVTFDHQDHFAKMLAKDDPDLVIITLGANDVFLPTPSRVAKNVASIAKKTEGRRCFWIGPPVWKKDTGIVDVIRNNCAPCIFYDSSKLKLERRADGIHPDDKGGEAWASAFWDFYNSPAASSPAPSSGPAASSLSPVR